MSEDPIRIPRISKDVLPVQGVTNAVHLILRTAE